MDRSIGDMPTVSGGSEPSWKGILEPGSFFGRYKVCRFLGRGGMGEVYEVEHELDGTHYAMKVLSSEIPQTPENIRRFEREAQVMARLQHPNVISVDYFDETDGKYWFRMELVQGIEDGVVTLGDLAAKNGGRIGQGLLVCLFEHILDGLSCAHQRGVIHRDLKPSNILLAHSDEIAGGIIPKISDFGLVRLVGQDWLLKKTLISAQQSLGDGEIEGTKGSQGLSTQSLVGTYAYMSPEQKQRTQIDERSDIYAVGLMIYRLLTGYTNPGERVRNKDSTLHAFWQRIIDQSVREDPKDRFASAAAMLVEVQSGRRVLASLDGKVSLQKCRAEFQAKRHYTANRYLDEAAMIFPDDPEVLGFRALMREQLGILHGLRSKMQDLRRKKEYEGALRVSEQFHDICVEDDDINKFISEFPQLITREQSKQLSEEASRLLEAKEFEAAGHTARKALSLDPDNRQAERIHDQALTMLKKMQIQQTREQVSKGLHQVYSLLKQKRYAEAMATLKHTPCSDSNHPKVIALRNACQAGLHKIRQYWKRAEEARASSDYQQAMSLLNEVLQSIAPEDPDTIERLNQLKREVDELSTAFTEMDHAWKNKSFKECLNAAQRILAIQPEHAKAQQYKLACLDKIKAIQMYVEKAEEYYQKQQYDEAIDTYKQTKKHYHLGKRSAKDDAEIESLHNVYSAEYKEILDRVATIHKAKTSMEQALQRAKESLEAGDLIETRLALNEYFELQANGKEGLLLQQKLESLHRRARMIRWMRRGVACLAAALIVGIGLAYGTASLVRTYRMQKELEGSHSALAFANLKRTQEHAGEQLATLQNFRLAPLFAVGERWKKWKEGLDSSERAWEYYACGEYEDGKRELENVPPSEFRPRIQRAFEVFEQYANTSCADANNQLVEGAYDDCIKGCDVFLLAYPQHKPVLDLLAKAKGAEELERRVYDPNIDLASLSEHIRDLMQISPHHRERQKLEEQCIQRVESKYDFLSKLLPTGVNAIRTQRDLCDRALPDIDLFKQCHGYEDLYKKLTNRKKDLEALLANIGENENLRDRLAEANSWIEQRCWGKAKGVLDTLDPTRKEVAQPKGVVAENMMQLEDLVKRAEEQVERESWFDAQETLNQVWSLWSKDDTWDLLKKANQLQTKINEFVQEENAEIRTFVEAMDQKDHTQIEEFVLDRVGRNYGLTPIYTKWFSRLDRDAQDALAQAKVNTALNLLSRVLNNERIISDANGESLGRLLQNLRADQKLAERSLNRAMELTDNARGLQSGGQCPQALWDLHWALEMNCECDDARKSQTRLQSLERIATQFWQDAKLLYDANCYFAAWKKVTPAVDFPGDLRVIALSRDLEDKMNEARQAATDVLSRKISVKEFYDRYVDYGEFPSDVDRRVKKEILRDLRDRIADRSQEERRRIIIEARRSVLQDEAEYQGFVTKYGSGTTPAPLFPVNIPNANWCQIKFYPPPQGADVTIQIDGHGLKALNRAFVRCEDEVYIQVSKSTDRNCSRSKALALDPWKVYQIRVKSSWSSVKIAEVQVVKKGWMLFKELDLDAMAEQITEYQIDKARARKSLQLVLDQMRDEKDITALQVPVIGWWQEEQFVEIVEIKVEK